MKTGSMAGIRTIVVVMIACLTVLAASCGSPAPAVPSSKPVPSPAPATSAPVVPVPATTPAAVQPKTGGVLRFDSQVAPSGFDLHRKPLYGPLFALPIFNNLFRFDSLKYDIVPENIVPDLAERWEISPDGKTWKFFLRKGVKWHDGTAFGADDVVYSVSKMMDPKRSSLATSFLGYDRVEKIDDSTVAIYLKDASPAFAINMAGPYAIIESKSTADLDMRSTDFLMGTGPFKFKTGLAGVSYEYVKNPDYFKKGLPYLDGLLIYVMTSHTAALSAFTSGRTDLGQPINFISSQEEWETAVTWKDTTLKNTGGHPGPVIWYNMDYQPLKDVRVRRALSLLVDGRQMTVAALGAEQWGNYEVGYFKAGSGYGLPKADLEKLLGRDKPYDQRVNEAKKLMVDAGFAQGFNLKILTANYPVNQKRASLLSDLLKRYLNIESQIVSLEPAQAKLAMIAKDFHIAVDQPQAMLGDPEEIMSYFSTGAANNISGYSNPLVDKMWQDQSRTMDGVKRRQITQEIERTLLTDLPAVPTAGMVQVLAWKNYVHYPLQSISYGSNMVFEQAWMDK